MDEKEIRRRLTDLELFVDLQKLVQNLHSFSYFAPSPWHQNEEHVEESSLLLCKKLPATNMAGSDKPCVRSRKREIIAGAALTGKANLKKVVLCYHQVMDIES